MNGCIGAFVSRHAHSKQFHHFYKKCGLVDFMSHLYQTFKSHLYEN